MGIAGSTVLKPRLPTGLPDDWAFDRDLPCPKCRYNLRMLSTPRCPECGTVFRWQELLQVTCPRCDEWLAGVDDNECPRCGLILNWPGLLQDADMEQLKQFEYTNRPVAAAIRLWFIALLPQRFWINVRIESPPARWRLRWLRIGAIGICVLGLVLAALVNRRAVAAGALGWGVLAAIAEIALILPLFTSLALPLFIPTMARFRIRRDQLLRCSAYGCSGLVWIGLAMILAAVGAEVVNALGWVSARRYPTAGLYFDPLIALNVIFGRPSRWFWSSRGYALVCFNLAAIALLFVFGWLWWWRCLYVSLRRYLRLTFYNSVALFLSTQVIGVLLIAYALFQWDHFLWFLGRILTR